MQLKIALLAGDGIGPEVIEQAVKVSNAVAKNTVTILNGFQHLQVLLLLMQLDTLIQKKPMRFVLNQMLYCSVLSEILNLTMIH